MYSDPDLCNSRELILHGETGLLAVSKNWKDLALQITRFIGDFDLRKRLAEAGRVRVMSEFAFDECIETVAIKYGYLDKADTTFQETGCK